ncbi:hypothetical protein [Sorangium cellulosum]|uniref:hypothetical protein n=1 Tax=Sorangium cellulosum TaxID=56 RepID=UPI0011DC90D5|nr:hypothetical protein [Sorangium cellulosum]
MRVVAADFFGRGLFGCLASKVPLAGVKDCLGDPDDVSIQKRPIEILKYGNVQIHCGVVGVVLIVVSLWSRELPIHPRVEFEGWDALWECGLVNFQAAMSSLCVWCVVNPALTFGDQRAFVVGGSVNAVFVDDMIDRVELF